MTLVALGKGSGATPAFLVHALGGSVLPYRGLAARLAHPACGIEAPGSDGQAAPLDCIEAMAATYIDEIRAHGAPAVWLLAGWSLGGVVAFEMSRQLAQVGLRACAALLDSRGLVERDGSAQPPEPPLSPMENNDVREALRATHAAHLSALARYRPGRTTAPLLVVRATDVAGASDDDLGFAALAKGPLVTLAVPASHTGLLAPPAVDLVARALDDFFARWESERA
jgi:thioesterase domain-containing protein